MTEVLAGNATPAQIAGFIVALRMKGETVEEIVGLLAAMQAAAESVPLADVDGVVDTCGTGGDRSHSINVSTIAAIVVAGAGREGVQARQPRRLVGVRERRPARGARRHHRPRARRGRPLRRGGGHRLLLRAPLPPGHAARHPDPA